MAVSSGVACRIAWSWVLNAVFFALVALAFAVAGYREITWIAVPDEKSPMEALSLAMIDSAAASVTLAIGLVGVMALFLGLMKVAEAGGLLVIIARTVRPLMVRLFPEVPPDHPAMGAIILNISANVLGLGNAATPFGIRAMQELDSLNPNKGTATNAMALFLAINTSSVTILPTGIIALRAAAGSDDPAGILPTTLFATICSTAVAIIACKIYQRFTAVPATPDFETLDEGAAGAEGESATTLRSETSQGYPAWVSMAVLAGIVGLIPLMILYGRQVSPWIIPGLMIGLLSFGVARGVATYEVFVEGAKDGFDVALRIIPYLVAILVAVGMFRASGAMELLLVPLGSVTGLFGLPPEALSMALLRPLSGSGAYGIVASIIENPDIGPDSYIGYLVSTLQGSTETTFYVIAVYFGAVQVRRIRHALAAGLTADLAGVVAAVVIVSILFG
jgi:spore maturation protein SpmA/spore maturation protein SpmB